MTGPGQTVSTVVVANNSSNVSIFRFSSSALHITAISCSVKTDLVQLLHIDVYIYLMPFVILIAFSFKLISVLLAFYCVYCCGVVVLTYAGNKARQEGRQKRPL